VAFFAAARQRESERRCDRFGGFAPLPSPGNTRSIAAYPLPAARESPMDVINYFSPDYQAARVKFLEAATHAGLVIENHLNPNSKGPDGGALYTDVAVWGDPSADRVLLAN